MAKGPTVALQPTEKDNLAVELLEKYIDESPEMEKFDGGECKIPLPHKLCEELLTIRTSVRYGALRDRYAKAGWKQIALNGQGSTRTFVLNQHEYRSSGGRD